MSNIVEPKDGQITMIDPKRGRIWYSYKGDEIAWTGTHYLSIGAEGSFKTLEDLDKFWEDFAEANAS